MTFLVICIGTKSPPPFLFGCDASAPHWQSSYARVCKTRHVGAIPAWGFYCSEVISKTRLFNCGCGICDAYHAHRLQANDEKRKEYERRREQTPERKALKRAITARWRADHKN